jgi:hypothetical protein
MNTATPFAGAAAATLVTAILVGSMALGFLLALGGWTWGLSIWRRRRNPQEVPRWMSVNPTLQRHLRHGELAASVFHHPPQTDSLPVSEPRPHSDCDDPPAC